MEDLNAKAVCVNCGRDGDEIPVLHFQFKGQPYGICSGCLPILLHKPGKLAGKLPGAEEIEPASHSH